jgi:hypothetical protein
MANDEIYDDSNIDTFRTLAHVRMTVLASNAMGVVINRTDSASTTRPMADYLIKFEKSGKVEIEYGSVTVRNPTTLPASQR